MEHRSSKIPEYQIDWGTGTYMFQYIPSKYGNDIVHDNFIYIYVYFFFFLYLLPMTCEMKNNEVQTFLPGPEVVVPRYRFGDEDPKNHGICVYIYISFKD